VVKRWELDRLGGQRGHVDDKAEEVVCACGVRFCACVMGVCVKLCVVWQCNACQVVKREKTQTPEGVAKGWVHHTESGGELRWWW
jgi:hypothetical protein